MLGLLNGLCAAGALFAATGTITYTYDEAGRLTTASFPDGATRTYGLDAAGNRKQTTDTAGNGTLVLSAGSYAVGESGTSITITVVRTGQTQGAVGVSYSTSNGTAVAGSDYTTTSGTLSWAAGVGGNKTFSVPVLNDGVQESAEIFTVTISTPTGGAVLGSPTSATVTVDDDDDTTVPSVPGTPSFSSIAETTATASWAAASDNFGVTGYRYRLNGGAWNTLSNVLTVNLTGLTAVTNYAFDVQARDAAGNWGASASNSFNTIDTTAPGLPGTPSFTSVAETTATANWTAASDNVGVTGYRYRLNGGGWNTLGNVLTVNFSGLSVVTGYAFDVQARDAAGNWGANASNSFTTLDQTAPGVPGTPTFTNILSTSATANWTAASDNVGVTGYRYRLNGGAWNTLGNVLTTNLTGLTTATSYTLDVQARDAAGSWSSSSSGTFIPGDEIPPSSPGTPSLSSIAETTATASWTAASDNVAVTGYRYRLNGGTWNTLGNVLTVNLSGLSVVTGYAFDVQARDAAGNWGSSSTNSFTTVDQTAPGQPGAPSFSNILSTTATANWTAASDNVGVTGYRYRLNGGAWNTLGNVLTTNLTGLTTATSYTLDVQARDAAGSWSSSNSGSFITADENPPSSPGTPSFSSIAATTTTASWTAATDNVGVTGYRYRVNGGGWNTLSNVLTVNLTGLAQGTYCAFDVQARDAAGNWGASSSNSFTTLYSNDSLSITESSASDTYFQYYVEGYSSSALTSPPFGAVGSVSPSTDVSGKQVMAFRSIYEWIYVPYEDESYGGYYVLQGGTTTELQLYVPSGVNPGQSYISSIMYLGSALYGYQATYSWNATTKMALWTFPRINNATGGTLTIVH